MLIFTVGYMIHPSHSKKDLVEIVERFQLYQIDNYKDMKKDKLSLKIWDVLKTLEYIPPETEWFFISDVFDLREYLRIQTTKQITTNSVKYDVTDRVKNLIFYAKGGYVFTGTNYNTIDDVLIDAEFIKHYGDLPSVRRAIHLLNGDVKMPIQLSPIMTRRVEQRVAKDKEIKIQNTPKFHMKTGTFLIEF